MPVIEHWQLLTYAKAIAGDWEAKNLVGEFFAPTVVVGGGQFFYRDYKSGNAFRIVDTGRALGGPAARMAMDIDDIAGITTENALEAFIDDQERINNPLTVSQIQRRKVADLTYTSLNNNLRKVLTVARSVTAVSGGTPLQGSWFTNAAVPPAASSIDPIQDIDTQCKAILDATGILPNKIYMDANAWLIFRNHAAVLARVKIGVAVINPEFAASLTAFPLEWHIGGGQKYYEPTTGHGDVFIFRSDDDPSTDDASWMKTFVQQEGRFTNVRSYRDENRSSDVFKLLWWQTIATTGAALVRRLTIT
jgi:hypothetical protein